MGASAMGSKFGKTASRASLLFKRTLPNSNINLNKIKFITINNERFEATYELIESSDKEYYWSLLDEVYPTFQMYRKRTDRDIPLIKFSKVEA